MQGLGLVTRALPLRTAPVLKPCGQYRQTPDDQASLGDDHVTVEAADDTLVDLFPHPPQAIPTRTTDAEPFGPNDMIEGQNIRVKLPTVHAGVCYLVPIDSIPDNLPIVPTPLVVSFAVVVLPVNQFPSPEAIVP